MKAVCNGAREWPSYFNNRQDAACSERRDEVLTQLRLRLTHRDISYTNQKIQNFEFLRSNITFGDFR